MRLSVITILLFLPISSLANTPAQPPLEAEAVLEKLYLSAGSAVSSTGFGSSRTSACADAHRAISQICSIGGSVSSFGDCECEENSAGWQCVSVGYCSD
jgi:hypothetical protein